MQVRSESAVSPSRIPSFCRVCHHCCPIVVDVVDGRPVAVVGDPDNSTYQGYSCVKGRAQSAMLQHPDRVLRSLKRYPDGSLRPIPVEDAMDEIAERLTSIIAEHGPRSVASYFGTMAATNATASPLVYAFMRGIGSPMMFTPNTIDKPGKSIARALHGGWMAPRQGFDRPEVALMIGINPPVAYQGAPFGNPSKWLTARLREGLSLIVIDPRRSDVARRATLHLQPRPGCDAPILAAMIRTILAEGLHDREFVSESTIGSDQLRRQVDPFTPARVAAFADVPAEDIVDAARTYARATRGYAIAGTGPAMSGAGTLIEYLVLVLDSLCGRYLRAGERVLNTPVLMPSPTPRAQAGPLRPAFGFGEQMRVRGLTETAAGIPTGAAADEMLLDGPGRIRALLSCAGNPVAAWPGTSRTVAALSGLDLLVQIDPWMSQTAELADYVIAPTMPLERADVTVLHDLSMAPHVGPEVSWAQYTGPIADRPDGSELVDEWELFHGLARRMGLPMTIDRQVLFPIGPFEIDTTQSTTTDDLLELLTSGGRVSLDEVKRHPQGAPFAVDVVVQPADPSSTDRQHLASEPMMRDLAALARAIEHASAPARPFVMVPRRVQQAYNSSCTDELTHRGRAYNPAYLHPDDLAAIGVADGNPVELTSDVGTVVAIAHPDPHLRRGLVSISFGYGAAHAAGAREMHDVRAHGTNVNWLLDPDEGFEPYSGQPLMSNVPVTVTALDT